MELEKKLKRTRRDEDGEDGYCSPLLTEDILFEEILPRLPVESLIKFKRVSKKWLHHISEDSRFIDKHLRHQSQTTECSIIIPRSTFNMYLLDHPSKRAQVQDLSFHMNRFYMTFKDLGVVGSCNGLVCVWIRLRDEEPHPLVVHQNQRGAILLWNPETGEGRDTLVPPLPPSFYQRPGKPKLRRFVSDYPIYGFGFDEYRDDYKVVRVVPTQPILLNFDVFSRNSGCWRRLEKGLLGYTVCAESSDHVHLNGCLYWLILAMEGSFTSVGRRCILSFDLSDEEFRIIDVLEHRAYFDAHLFRHLLIKWEQNCLAYLSFPYDQRCGFDFRFRLILNSNGNVVVEGLNAPSARGVAWSNEPPSASIPVYVSKSKWKFCGVSHGRLFMEERDARPDGLTMKLIMYDSFGCIVENVGHVALSVADGFWDSHSVCAVHEYVPSLVSVYPNRKIMMVEKKKMAMKYWVDMFWNMVGLSKHQFGLGMAV